MSNLSSRMMHEASGAGEELTDALFNRLIEYCWVDEDGARVSPIHRDFGPALTFATDWARKAKRIEDRATQLQRNFEVDYRNADTNRHHQERILSSFEREMGKVREQQQKLTITGKPPVRLKRMVTVVTVQDPTATELELAEAAVAKQFEEE